MSTAKEGKTMETKQTKKQMIAEYKKTTEARDGIAIRIQELNAMYPIDNVRMAMYEAMNTLNEWARIQASKLRDIGVRA